MDYSILYKDSYSSLKELQDCNEWDIFISAYNLNDRVKNTFDSAVAKKKIWVIHPEYGFDQEKLPLDNDKFFFNIDDTESQNIRSFFESNIIDLSLLSGQKVCIDSTGFMRPTLMFLIFYMRQQLKMNKFDIIYSEPVSYGQNENTTFSKETTGRVKTVDGFELHSERDQSGDLLVIGAGFDDKLIAEVIEAKKHARIVYIIGFPSLQADMYQQNLYRASRVDEATSDGEDNIRYAPANDPFITANILKEIIKEKEKERRITNLFLSPLSTKAQTIGFALYYINECFEKGKDASVLIPENKSYSEKTSIGISNIWKYQIEFPLIS